MRIHLNQKICRNMMMLLAFWLMSIQTLWAQSLSFQDLKETCDFTKGTISYTLSTEKLPEINNFTWKVKVDDKEITDGNTLSADTRTLTLPLSQETRSVEVSYTDANQAVQTFSFNIEPKVYGKEYNGVKFYADAYDGGDGSKDKPFIINTDLQLAKLAREVTNGTSNTMYNGQYFQLSSNIDLGKGIWMPIGTLKKSTAGYFGGTFDGDGKTIRNMKIYWTTNGGEEASWGLFSRLNGTKDKFATVTNLMIDNARLEVSTEKLPTEEGTIKMGVVVSDLIDYAEVSNIIIKNSTITDREEKYSTKNTCRIGGIIGYLDGKNYRIFNLSSDTKINIHKNASLSNNKFVTVAGGIGCASTFTKINAILPTNIYIHGPQMVTSTSAKCTRGSVIAFYSTNYVKNLPDANIQTLYYTKASKGTGASDYNMGIVKEIAAFGNEFIKINNDFISNQQLDKKTWAYSASTNFAFNSIKIKMVRGTSDVLTVVSADGNTAAGTYDWYVSDDNIHWTQANSGACNPFTLPRKLNDQYVYATDGSSRTNAILVKAIHVDASLTTSGNTYTVNVTNDTENFTNEQLGLTITYKWHNGDTELSEESASFTRPSNATYNDKYSCHVTVKSGSTTFLDTWVSATTVVYLKPASSITDDIKTTEENNIKNPEYGYSAEKPMLTWKGAYSKLSEKGSWDENIIVLMGESHAGVTNDKTYGFNITDNNGNNILTGTMWETAKKSSFLFRNATITGTYNGVTYSEGSIEITDLDKGLPLWGDTRFEYITFKNNSSGGASYKNIFCQYNNLEMGKGIKMEGFKDNAINYGTIDGAVTTPMQIFGGFNNDGRFYPLATKENIDDFEASMPHGKEGFSITIKSGFYSAICVGGRQTAKTDLNGVMGTPNQPIKCTITMDIDRVWNDAHNETKTIDGLSRTNDYDAGIILAGNHEGAMYADVDIIIRSGKVARIVNGTLGAQTEFELTYNNQTYKVPCNTYMGRANITLDPENSENNKIEEKNARVVVTELYGGSMGRGHNGNVTINNPFYGYSTITINGGTFKILPEGNNKKSNILCGIFGAGAGGMNGIGYGDDNADTHTPDASIAYWNDAKNVMLYGPYAAAKNKLVQYHCYNANDYKYTDVDPSLTNTQIIINGGIFGSKTEKIDGIYAGGSGYMSPGLWTSSGAIPSTTGGNVYGSKGKTAVSLTINGGEFYCEKGIFAGGRGTNQYYSSKPYGGTASDYTALGQTYGNVALNINGGNFFCPIFGGGYGVADAKLNHTTDNITTLSKMALIKGQSNVTINGGTFYQNIYGGGDMAVVENEGNDATNITIGGDADIRGSVFAGGNGRTRRLTNQTFDAAVENTQSPELVGKVIGNTNVTFTGSTQQAPYIYGDIYGGGNLAQVEGGTNVNIYAAHFAGQIFGGGKGNITDQNGEPLTDKDQFTSADISGDTYVTLAQDMGGQEEGDDGKKKDNFSINVIWNKIWDTTDANNPKFIEWNPTKDKTNQDKFYGTDATSSKPHFLNPHNIYGGGNLACNVTGSAFVEVLKGMTPFDLLNTAEWKESYNDNNYPHFSVFGGGYGEYTQINETEVHVNVEGDYGIYDAEVNDKTEQLARPHSVSRKSSRKGTRANSDTNSNTTTLPVFDNSKGIPNFTILGVLGGGYAGKVTKTTKVIVAGNTFLHRVYGGGFGDPNKTEDNKTGQIGDNSTDARAEVFINGGNIYGDVFGGGAGVAPKTANGTHFENVARVNGTTLVQVSDQAKIYGKVFGGGDMANVGPQNYNPNYAIKPISETKIDPNTGDIDRETRYEAKQYCTLVNIIGGDIFGSVYGGGKGLPKAQAASYEKVGRINGNTIVHIANTDITQNISIDYYGNTVPHVWGNIYGGCAYGTVDGNTLVHIEGGMLGKNIFGGGFGDIVINKVEDENQKVLGSLDTEKTATYANILGNTKVQMDGGTWIWNRNADTDGNITTWLAAQENAEKIFSSKEEFMKMVLTLQQVETIAELPEGKLKNAILKIQNDKDTQEFFSFKNEKILSGCFKKNNNIYGGGNRACYVGTYTDTNATTVKEHTGEAIVEINHSPLDDIVDKNGNPLSMFDETTLPALCWYLSAKNPSNPQFSVFGAGYGANTKVAKTQVYAQPGSKINDNGLLEVNGVKYRYLNQSKDFDTYKNFEINLYNDFIKLDPVVKKELYGSDGNDKDPNTYQRYRASCLAWTLGLPGFSFQTIHGGGFAGYVTESTYVETDCQLFCENIYGAGLGAIPYGDYTNSDNYDFGSVTGNSKVFVKSGFIARNLYGGGAGIESVKTSDGEFIDFPNMAHVNKTEVHLYGRDIYFQATEGMIDRTIVMGSVYGGGDVANVGSTEADRTTLVNIRGGSIYSAAFAGGKGRLLTQCKDYKKLGRVKGNTYLLIDRPCMTYPYWDDVKKAYKDPSDDENMAHPNDTTNPDYIPNLLERIYGGGQNGIIEGNTTVRIYDGYIGHGIYGGGLGSCDSIIVNGQDSLAVTSADVSGDTHVLIYGGRALLTSYWKPETRSWEKTSTFDGITYSPQYDHEALKFKINHNIYAGGNIACEVGKNTYLTMAKGLLHKDTKVVSSQDIDDKYNFFDTNEWKEIYNKVGSPHFCVFGGGYGEHTVIKGNTYVNIAMEGRGSKIDPSIDLVPGQEHKHFWSGYSVMDFVGGGYSGKVEGETFVTGKGGAFCRRLFGGGFYNSVMKTHVNIEAMDCRDIFGGGMMGDVIESTEVNIGKDGDTATSSESESAGSTYTHKDIFIHGNVFGGNDVSGYVNINDADGYFADNGGKGTQINIYGGHIDGNVYGAGNGDYLYALDRKGNTQVTVNENYPLNPNDPSSEKTPLVYTVPMRASMPSHKAASDAAKMVNINSWRPLTNKVNIYIAGKNASDTVLIKGDVYGGGNSATVLKVKDAKIKSSDATCGSVNIKIGSYVNIHGLFMGCNGDALFTASEDNNFMNKFQKLNGDYYDTSKELNFADSIDWVNDPSNRGISALYLPTKSEERPLVYPHLINLYFQPVEMNIQGSLDWDQDLKNCTIGSFFCGGNRGNMNIYPDAEGKVVDYTFPKGLTITEKIVGGCNNANYDYNGQVTHEGGYLLGLAHSTTPFINLTIQNKFAPKEVNGAYQGGCVYGGCFNSGTVRGDITIHLQSDLLAGKDKKKLEAANDSLATNPKFSSLNVYGAGYGMESYVYGNTRIIMGENIKCVEPTEANGMFKACGVADTDNTEGLGVSANFVYGGGQQGNVIGLTDVDILNGHVFRSVTGGSYSGYVYGSTQVKVGYPTYYQVNSLKNGKYILNRTDQKNRELKNNDGTTESPTIKQEIHLLAGELISQGVYDDIVAIDNGTKVDINESNKGEYFTKINAATSSIDWKNVHIHIDEAIYGGGYSLAQGTSVLANNTTVLKLTEGTNAGFGGNTLILVGDNKSSEHITISQQDMKEISLPNGTDLYGYYYKYYDDKNSKQYTYRFIYEQVKYIKGDQVPEGLTGCLENKFYEYDSEGGIFGDGHLSYAQGFRSADISGYGFAGHTINNPKIINTFQRMDLLRLEDNCFSLLGARDYTVNEINKTPYSIARVGEIKMVATDIQLKDGKLQAEPKTANTSDTFKYGYKARNYMGLANNIHYVGAVKSNVSFSKDTWHNEYGEASAQKYQEFKQEIITNYEKDKEQNASEFLKRNNGTAKNMIGIASGYALKIQNVQEKIDKATQKMTETIYYGPIYGVVEMNLMNARTGEGGGYVYADNIHEVPGGTSKGFLQTTGNFVFPLNSRNTGNNRYIIDDCSPTGFYAMGEGANPDEKAEIHYWYVTGLNYYYNAHITGYTYKEKIHFDNDNSDGLTALAGLKHGQEIYIKSWKMRSGHDENYKCDLETAKTADKYTLYVGASASNTYAGPKTSSETDKAQNGGFAAILSLSEKKNPDNKESEEYQSTCLNSTLPAELNGDAKISFRLMDNNTDASPEYYHQHLEKKCQATLVLGAKQLDENGNPKKDENGKEIEYTYTIFLTIEYVKGPNFTGHITIDNCALPGEMIRLKKDQVKIASDQAFAPNGYFWHIGKVKMDNKGDLQFDEDESWLTKTKDSKNTYKQGDKIDETRTDLFAGSVYDKTLDYLDIPAYYFMNGYGVQLGVTMNGFNDVVFPVTMAAGDTLTVHNYHEMDPHKNGVNLRLPEAIERVSKEKNLAEPRIYISDQDDLKAFGKFISATENEGGKYAQFILQNDLEIPADYTGSNAIFQGTFHGNGHILRGLEENKTLFAENQGNIYNLGLLSGSIAQQNSSSNASGYHCCFEYAPSASPDTPIVYDMDGKAINTYTKDDFKYGKVAYDLNGYYLRARTSHSAEADKTALEYVYDYYANGDYQYAHRTDAITGRNTGITYLRTGQDSDLPNYGKAATRHDKTHTIDQARAQDYQAATEETKESRTGNYLPQFNQNAKKGGELMNDFLFWGQDLQSSPALYPARIASQENLYMSNRVYRTAGYYGSIEKGLYHYNAYNQGTKNMGTYVHIPSTTAIDFTAQDDNATNFYAFIIKKGVTQNLLVYTDAGNETSTTDAYHVVRTKLNYDEQTSEERILGHHIIKKVVDGNPSYGTPLLHLVERTPTGENSEGKACDNNDFCVPIPFSVTSHAWYIRKPSLYANDATGAWEGICLPFTVNKAEASFNGEITHFYGDDTKYGTQYHEYWLRGLTSVDVDQKDGKILATFQRPGTASGLFQAGNAGSAESAASPDYIFENHFFENTYGDLLYNKVENPYYTQQHTYAGYQPLKAGTPYVVRFPGERFYEFDLSSVFYNNLKNAKEPAQTVTFHAFGESYAGDDAKTKGAIVIPITAEMKTLPAEMKTATSGYAHMGTFAARKVKEDAVYGMNAQGTAFDDASTLATVMPFRTYMAKTQTAAQTRSANPSVIHIAETTGIDRIEPEVNGNEEDSESGDYLIIRSIGSSRVRVESTYSIQLKVFASTGQLYRILDVQPGTATYSGFHPGLYIFGDRKIMVK